MSFLLNTNLTMDEVILLAKASQAAYADKALLDRWHPITPYQLGLSSRYQDGNYFQSLPGFGASSALVLESDDKSKIILSFRGTDVEDIISRSIDTSDYPQLVLSSLSDLAYIHNFDPLLKALSDYIGTQSVGLYVTGHSLGAGAANQLADIATIKYDGRYASAKFVAFASPKITDSNGILNIGFENDPVYKFGGRSIDNLSSTDNLVWASDAYMGGDDGGVIPIPFNPNTTDAHGIENYIYAMERLRASSYYDLTSFDSPIIFDHAFGQVHDRNPDRGGHVTYLLGEAGSNDQISGGNGDDFIEGSSGDDAISGGLGNDTIDGGEGIDTAMYALTRDHYHITFNGATATIQAIFQPPLINEGTDVLTNIEKFNFGGVIYTKEQLTTALSFPELGTVLSFTGSGFDATRVFSPSVAKVANSYVMLYGGLPFADYIQIGLATSSDGVTWSRYSSEPVISNTQSPGWASFREVPITLMYENSTYKLWFNGDNTDLVSQSGRVSGFGYATSPDGANWTFNPNPIRIGSSFGLNLREVVKLNGQYVAYYMSGTLTGSIYEAISSDGVTFTSDVATNIPNGYIMEAAAAVSSNGQEHVFSIFQNYSSGLHYYGTSIDGTTFTIDGMINTPANFAPDDIHVEDGLLKLFGEANVGNINWGLPNVVIQYAATSSTIACFAGGTWIATPGGEVAVEDLRVSEEVVTLLGGSGRIVWTGSRTVDCARHPKPQAVWPIRIGKGSFGENRPFRDLFVSPDHALYINGKLIPAKYLTNGTTVCQIEVERITYHHIELEQHDVVLAEGLAAESYLDTGDRTKFAGGAVVASPPDFAARTWEMRGCAALVLGREMLETIKQ